MPITPVATNFPPNTPLQIAVDGYALRTVPDDAQGTLTFVLVFAPAAPAGTYTVTVATQALTKQHVSTTMELGQVQLMIDPGAPVLAPPTDASLPLINALPTLYLPLTMY